MLHQPIDPIARQSDFMEQKVVEKKRHQSPKLPPVKKFLTHVGDVPMQTEDASEIEACTLVLENRSQKMVLQFYKKFASDTEYASAKQDPRVAVDKWLRGVTPREWTLNINTPCVPQSGDAEWIDAILSVRDVLVGHFSTFSGWH